MAQKTHGVLSPEWAVKYARDCLSDFKRYKGVRLNNSQIKGWIRALSDAERIVLRVGPFMAKDENGRYGGLPDILFKGSIGSTCKTLREAVKFLQGLLKEGQPAQIMINRAVLGLSEQFEKRYPGRPHYRKVGEIITEVFRDYLPKKIADNDVEDWAKKKAKRWQKLLKSEQNFNRALMGHLRFQIENQLTNPLWTYRPNQRTTPVEPLTDEFWADVKAGKRTLLTG